MNCPQCGAAGQDGRAECSVCGILFERWRPREARPVLPPRPSAPPRQASNLDINYWLVIPVAVTILVVVVAWVSRSRPPAEAEPPKVETAAAPRPAVRSTARNLSDDDIRRMIEDCAYFEERLWARIPRSFFTNLAKDATERYPALIRAASMGVVALEPPFDIARAPYRASNPANPGEEIYVYAGPRASAVNVTQVGDEYHLDLGYRRVQSLSRVHRAEGEVTATFRWTVETAQLVDLAPDSQERTGRAEFRATPSGSWELVGVWRNAKTGATPVCSGKR